jgi:hypothetical protein
LAIRHAADPGDALAGHGDLLDRAYATDRMPEIFANESFLARFPYEDAFATSRSAGDERNVVFIRRQGVDLLGS